MISALIAAVFIMFASLSGKLLSYGLWGKWINKNMLFLVSFSVGVFSIISYSLLSEALSETDPQTVLIWSGAGAGLFFFLSLIMPEAHHHHSDHCCSDTHTRLDARRIMMADGFHNMADGLLLLPAFVASTSLGITMALGIFFHEVIQEISEFIVLRQAGYSIRRALLINFAWSATILIGIVISYFISDVEGIEPILVSIAGGAFLFTVGRDLIPSVFHDARLHHRTQHLLWLVAGAGIMLLVKAILGQY